MKELFYESEKDVNCGVYAQWQKEYEFGVLHFHRAFEIAYMLKGQMDFIVENDILPAEPNDIIFAHCYYAHMARPLPEHEKYVVIVPENFSGGLYSLLREKTLPSCMKDKEFNKTLLPFIEKLVEDSEKMSSIVLKGYINIIFGLLFEHYAPVDIKPKSKNVSLVASILTYIDANYTRPLTLEETAVALGYNKSYFSRLFNQCVGTSFNNYLNFLRLDKFEELLASSSDKSMTELAYECGFSSLATFYRVKKARAQNRKNVKK
ncbi:MAG: helix-turn-helix transcriptional regulator [Clostridia bacterium]|nr:helix-turn-helix transcriptional regulator [Clostridia bacterium]